MNFLATRVIVVILSVVVLVQAQFIINLQRSLTRTQEDVVSIQKAMIEHLRITTVDQDLLLKLATAVRYLQSRSREEATR